MRNLKLFLILIIWAVGLSQAAAETITNAGWHLKHVGAVSATELDDLLQNQAGLQSVWGWDHEQNNWMVKFKTNVEHSFLTLSELEQGKGYWFYISSSAILPDSTTATTWSLAENSGWHLLGTHDAIAAKDAISNLPVYSDANGGGTIWMWDGTKWQLYVNGTKPVVFASFDDLDTLPAQTGFWVNMNGTSSNLPFTPRLQDFSAEILQGYATCEELKNDVEEAGKLLANLVITSKKQRYHYFDNPWWDIGIALPEGDDDVIFIDEIDDILEDVGMAETAGGDDNDGYGTNNQVDGVDESDVVKSDGQYLYIAFNNELVVHDLSGNVVDRYTLTESTTYKINPNAGERIVDLLIHNGKILTISNGYYLEGEQIVSGVTRLNRLEVDGSGKLTWLEEHWVKGRYQTARLIDGKAHLVTFATLHNRMLTRPLARRNFPDLTEAQYVEAATALAYILLPTWRDALMEQLFDSTALENPETCQHIAQISRMQQGNVSDDIDLTEGKGILNAFSQIQSLDMETGFSSNHLAGGFVPNQSVIAYAHSDLFILGGSGWDYTTDARWDQATYLMTFSLTDGNPIPQAVGKVQGSMLDQFSMDYYNGHIRMASTIDAQWGRNDDGHWDEFTPSQGIVTILKPNGSELEKTGELQGLGINERIFAARFIGDRGYVVTFRRVDPFYTLDLSDPTNPTKVGELKIPGFSTYLHPVDDNHILAIGRDNGLQIALYDVTDLAAPTQKYKYVVSGSSDALWDHKAFRYLATEQKLIIPFRSNNWWWNFGWRRSASSFKIFNVATDQEISEYGTIDPIENTCPSDSILKPRSLVFDNQLITLGDSTVRSHTLSPLSEQWSNDLSQTAWTCSKLDGRGFGEILYTQNTFAAFAYRKLFTSADGTEWTEQTLPNYNYTNVSEANGEVILLSRKHMVSSNDLSTWNTTSNSNRLEKIVYGNDVYLGISYSTVYTSTDRVNWLTVADTNLPSSNLSYYGAMRDVEFALDQFVLLTRGGKIFTSPNGNDWTVTYEDDSHHLHKIVASNERIVVLSDYGPSLVSTDGGTWTASAENQYYLGNPIYANGKFMAVAGNSISSSTDGLNWTNERLGLQLSLQGIVFGNNQTIAIDYYGYMVKKTESE